MTSTTATRDDDYSTRSTSPERCPVREAGVQTSCNGLPSDCSDTLILAGPLQIHVASDHKSFSMSGNRMQGSIESIKCWMNVVEVPQEFGFEVCIPSDRPGVSKTYRVVCKSGLMHQETVEGPALNDETPSYPINLPSEILLPTCPSSPSSKPEDTHPAAVCKPEDIPDPSSGMQSLTLKEVTVGMPQEESHAIAAIAGHMSDSIVKGQTRKSLAWEVLM